MDKLEDRFMVEEELHDYFRCSEGHEFPKKAWTYEGESKRWCPQCRKIYDTSQLGEFKKLI